MSEARLRLAPDVVPEPLVLGWYAWPHLVSPARRPTKAGKV